MRLAYDDTNDTDELDLSLHLTITNRSNLVTEITSIKKCRKKTTYNIIKLRTQITNTININRLEWLNTQQ